MDVEELFELYEERAAIRQYEGEMTREEAERLAWQDVFKNQGETK